MADYDRFIAAVGNAADAAESAKIDLGNMLWGPRVDERYKFDSLALTDDETERLEKTANEFRQAVEEIRKKALGY